MSHIISISKKSFGIAAALSLSVALVSGCGPKEAGALKDPVVGPEMKDYPYEQLPDNLIYSSNRVFLWGTDLNRDQVAYIRRLSQQIDKFDSEAFLLRTERDRILGIFTAAWEEKRNSLRTLRETRYLPQAERFPEKLPLADELISTEDQLAAEQEKPEAERNPERVAQWEARIAELRRDRNVRTISGIKRQMAELEKEIDTLAAPHDPEGQLARRFDENSSRAAIVSRDGADLSQTIQCHVDWFNDQPDKIVVSKDGKGGFSVQIDSWTPKTCRKPNGNCADPELKCVEHEASARVPNSFSTSDQTIQNVTYVSRGGILEFEVVVRDLERDEAREIWKFRLPRAENELTRTDSRVMLLGTASRRLLDGYCSELERQLNGCERQGAAKFVE